MTLLPLLSRMTRVLASSLLAAVLAFSSVAAADDASAAEHARRGRVAYDLRDWPAAIKEYRTAYETEQKPDYLFGLAQAERQSGDFASAIASFKSYKRLESVSPQQATAADLLIDRCETEQAIPSLHLHAFSPEEIKAEATAHEEAQAATRASASAPVPTATAKADVDATSTSARNTPAASSPRFSSTDDDAGRRKPFYEDIAGDSLCVLGLGAAGVGTFFVLKGNADMRQSTSAATDALASSAASRARSEQAAGAVITPLGAALVGAAVIRWITTGNANVRKPTGWLAGPTYLGYSGQF